jgi:hypothetical protein
MPRIDLAPTVPAQPRFDEKDTAIVSRDVAPVLVRDVEKHDAPDDNAHADDAHDASRADDTTAEDFAASKAQSAPKSGTFSPLSLLLSKNGGVTRDDKLRLADDIVHKARTEGVDPVTSLRAASLPAVPVYAFVMRGAGGGLVREQEPVALAESKRGVVGLSTAKDDAVLSLVLEKSAVSGADHDAARALNRRPLLAFMPWPREVWKARVDKSSIQIALQRVVENAATSLSASGHERLADLVRGAADRSPARTLNDDQKYTPEQWRMVGKDFKQQVSSGYMTETHWRTLEPKQAWYGSYDDVQHIVDVRTLPMALDKLEPGDLALIAKHLATALDAG